MERHYSSVADEVTALVAQTRSGPPVVSLRFTTRNGPSYTSSTIEGMRLEDVPGLIEQLTKIAEQEGLI